MAARSAAKEMPGRVRQSGMKVPRILQVQDAHGPAGLLHSRRMNYLIPPPSSFVARLAITATLALAGLASQPSVAQPVTVTLLHNLDQAETCGATGSPDAAARFRTGSLPLNIEAIQFTWEALGPTPGRNRLGIFEHDAVANRPGSIQVGGWKETNADTQVGTMTYNSATDIVLQPNTDYWVLADITDGSKPTCTTSPNFSAHGPAGSSPTLNRVAAIGNADTMDWPVLHTALTMVYALDGTEGPPPPPIGPDMAIGAVNLPATGTVGTPYAGSFECTNVGQSSTMPGSMCTATDLPPGLSMGACTLSPGQTPWNSQDVLPAGEGITCRIVGTPTAAGVYTVVLRTDSEVDANANNNQAQHTINIAPEGPGPGPGPGPTPGSVQSVPTLSEWAILLLGGLVLAAGVGWSRRPH